MGQFPGRVAIIGIGLLGGSIAKGIKKYAPGPVAIIGVGRTPLKLQQAKEEGIINMIASLETLPQDVDLVIIATPPGQVTTILQQLVRQQSKAVIIDVASTKQEICESAVTLPLLFVGTHPMAGKELSGRQHADADLFCGKPWIICPTTSTPPETVSRLEALVTMLGAQPLSMTPEKHDQLVAWVSHLPIAIATVLMHTVASQPEWGILQQIASTGLRDTTRLASESVEMKRDILLSNSDNILAALARMQQEIDMLRKLIKEKQPAALDTYLTAVQNARSALRSNTRKSP